MDKNKLLQEIDDAIHEIEPSAEIVLYGSHSRGEAGPESDWDLLVLVDGSVDEARTDRIRHRLYEIEWKSGEVISCIVRSHEEWNSPQYRIMPIHSEIEREGIVL